MQVNDASWRERGSLRLLCDELRSSLQEVTALQDDHVASVHSAEDESSTASASARLCFRCGSARYKESQKCWILRSSRDSSSKKPRSSAGRRRIRCGSVLAGVSIADTDEQMEPYHNTSIARVQFSESQGANASPAPPPVSLIQRIFRTTELRWAFETSESVIPATSNPNTRNKSDLFEKKTIGFEPLFSYLLENCNRYFGSHGRQQIRQDAIAFCSSVTSNDPLWTTEVFDSKGTRFSNKRSARIPGALRNFLEYCLQGGAVVAPRSTSRNETVSRPFPSCPRRRSVVACLLTLTKFLSARSESVGVRQIATATIE